ncbi:MAG: GIY-YIG nuclease family protein [Methylococcales bacterium]
MAYGENAGKSGVVYILREMDNHHKLGKRKTHLFKIGESTRSGKTRAIELTEEAREKGSNVSYEFITESRTQDCYGSEQLVFKRLEEFRLGSFGEWGGHELFEFIDDHQLKNAIKVIRETCVEVDNKLY